MNSEYGKRRSKSEFFEWVDAFCNSSMALAKIESLLDRDRDTKRMVEEVLPVYFLVKQLYRDRDDLFVEMTGDESVPDARILDRTGRLVEALEVTTALEPDDHKVRLQLGRGQDFATMWSAGLSRSPARYIERAKQLLARKGQARHASGTSLVVMLSNDLVDERAFFDEVVAELSKEVASCRYHRVVFLSPSGCAISVTPNADDGDGDQP